MRRRHLLGSVVGAAAAFAAGPDAAEKESILKDAITLKNDELEVVLDSQFPRVFEYRVPAGPRLLGAIVTERATVELNGTIYTPGEFIVTSQISGQYVSYALVFGKLRLTLELGFQLEGNELLMKLVRVDESGSFELQSLYFPNHYLLRMPALTSGASMYRCEFQHFPWNHPSHRGLFASTPRFAVIADEDGDEHPKRTNWAAMYASGLGATIANNIGYWKLASQCLGFSGRASDFALWNGTYYYRLRGKRQPVLESRIVILTRDGNDDGKVDWMEAALWHRKLLRAPSAIYAFPTYTYKIICAWWPKRKIQELAKMAPPGIPPWHKDISDNMSDGPVTTFEECLAIVKSNYALTGGVRQLVYLVGWQYDGHDDGYPSFDRVNPACGGREKLLWLVAEAKKYNAIIGYHINLDDAYPHNPGFDPTVLARGLDGKPYLWCYYGGVNPAYHISHTKQVESGYFQRRAQALLDTVPVEKTLNCDAFRYSNVSFAPGELIGVNEELAAVKQIFDWFAGKGIDIGSEGVLDGLYGTLSYFFHLGHTDLFQAVMTHGKAYGSGYGSGGKLPEPVLGWGSTFGANNVQARASSGRAAYSISAVCDGYYLGLLLRLYLQTKELRYLGPEGNDYVARFGDGCVSRCVNDPSEDRRYESLSVTEGNLLIARGRDDRFIPVGNDEVRLYSVTGGERVWTLPSGWAERKISLSELRAAGAHEVRQFAIEGNRLKLMMESRRPYVLRRK